MVQLDSRTPGRPRGTSPVRALRDPMGWLYAVHGLAPEYRELARLLDAMTPEGADAYEGPNRPLLLLLDCRVRALQLRLATLVDAGLIRREQPTRDTRSRRIVLLWRTGELAFRRRIELEEAANV